MRLINNVNDIMENEELVCVRLTIVDSNGKPSVMNIPVLVNENDVLNNGFTCTVDIMTCENSNIENEEDLIFSSPCDYEDVVEDIEIEFSDCLDSFEDEVVLNRRNELVLVPKKGHGDWKYDVHKKLERFSKGLDDDESDTREFKYIKHNVNIVAQSLLPYYKDKFTKHLEETAMYTNQRTLKIHLAVKEILKEIDSLEAIYEELR